MSDTIQKRKKIVEQAVANEQLEGLKVSKETTKIANQYISGKLTAKQAAKKIKARYGAL